MKNVLSLALLAIGLTACNTMNRAPYSGGLGEYGFTYDLDGSPSPFVDTSYRPLTVYDLAAPSVVIVTNRPPPREIVQTQPEIGVTRYAGESPTRPVVVGGVVNAQGQQINEAAGAARGTTAAGVAPAATPAGRGYGGYGGYGVPGVAVLVDGNQTNTNSISLTNTNSISLTNTNIINFGTNVTNAANSGTNGTNLNFAATNSLINEAAGSERTNGFPFPAQRTAPTPTQTRSNNVNTFNNTANPPAAGQPQDRNLLNQQNQNQNIQNPPAGDIPAAPAQTPTPTAPQTIAPRQGGISPQPR